MTLGNLPATGLQGLQAQRVFQRNFLMHAKLGLRALQAQHGRVLHAESIQRHTRCHGAATPTPEMAAVRGQSGYCMHM